MAGILDFLSGLTGASPFGALYQDPLAQRQKAAGDLLASMGVSPTAAPQISPFDLPQPPAPAPAAPAFGAGATPFGFAGPGSMNGINPASIIPPAAPQAAPAPAPAPIVAPPAAPVPAAPVNAAADDGEDATPANAAPTSGALPAAPGAPSSPAPFSLAGGGDNRLMKATRGFFGNMGAGPIGALAGGLGALITGQSTDPTSIANERMSATGQALISKGASPADVQAAVNNPALMTALLQQYYGKDKYKVVQTGEDGLGRKTFQLFNEADGTIKPIPGAPGGAAGGADAGIGDMTKKGPEYLATVPPAQRNTIQMMISGDLPPPTSFALAKPYWQNMIAAARNVDPNFTETNWSARVAMAKAAQGDGKIGQNNNALTTGVGHLKQLWDAIPALGNSDYSQTYNWAKNGISTEFGGTGATNFRAVANRVAPEIVKIWRGTGGAEADIKRDIESLNTSQTPSQLRGAISNIAGMMRSKLESNMQEYKATMGRDMPLTAEQQKTLSMIDQLEQAAGGSAAPAAPRLAPGQSTVINGTQIRRVN